MRLGIATRAAAWVGAGVLGAGLVTGIAEAHPWSSSSPANSAQTAASPSPTPNKDGQRPDGWRGRMQRRFGNKLGRTVHGIFVVKTKNGYVTMQMQRGTVSGISGSTFTVESSDHYSQQYTEDSNTKVRIDRQQASFSQLKNGELVGVLAMKNSDGSYTAKFIIVRTGQPSTSNQMFQGGPGGPGPAMFG